MNRVERHLLPNGAEVDYIDETHEYFINGIKYPSITELLKNKFGNQYNNVNPEILKRSSEYGTRVHKEIQSLIEMRDAGIEPFSEIQEVCNYFTYVEPIYNIQPISLEKVVVLYDQNNKPFACGRMDMLCFINNSLGLVDFKTTSSINRKYVTAQLNLYYKAACQSGYIDTDTYDDIQLGVIHLSGTTAKLIPMSKLSDEFYLTFVN